MKLLSVIIPTYNMEALLPRCLDSLVSAYNADNLLEVLVVNDGSKDHSIDVARDYEQRFPRVVHVIDKPNGNYGSTINAALPLAEGKYCKILDADDYFATAALDELLKRIDTWLSDGQELPDIIHTPFTQLGANGSREVIRYNTMGREPYSYVKIYNLDDILPDGYIRFFLMHALAYRTQMLREMHYRQTEGISYTDTEWACYPTFVAKTIVFLDYNIYQYNLDREGQTMDPKVLQKNVNQLQQVTDAMIDFYDNQAASLSPVRAKWMKQYFENRLRILYKIYLLDMPRENFIAKELQAMDDIYRPLCEKYGWQIKLYPENKLLRTEYIAYWHKHHKRWPLWYENVNRLVDKIVKWLYVKIVRR